MLSSSVFIFSPEWLTLYLKKILLHIGRYIQLFLKILHLKFNSLCSLKDYLRSMINQYEILSRLKSQSILYFLYHPLIQSQYCPPKENMLHYSHLSEEQNTHLSTRKTIQ